MCLFTSALPALLLLLLPAQLVPWALLRLLCWRVLLQFLLLRRLLYYSGVLTASPLL
jgi:hypothetical protein